jgi:replicative DNA helicase
VSLKKIRDQILSRPAISDEKNCPLTHEEEAALEACSDTNYLDNIQLSDAKGARLVDVLRIMSDMVVRHGCQVIWIDYIQAIYARSGDGRSRRDFLEYCWAMLEREAERLQVPLMLTAQLNREWEREPPGGMPGLRHVEWLGAAEQKAFVGAVLYRPYRDPRISSKNQDRRFNELVLNVEKSKQGETIAINYHFDPAACIIKEME